MDTGRTTPHHLSRSKARASACFAFGSSSHAWARALPSTAIVMHSSVPRLLVSLSLVLCGLLDARGAGADDEAFNREAALGALASVDVAHCKTKKGPTGEGHVIVTFSPNGAATSAIVDKGPFVGTKLEKCIVKDFKRAKVPPFKGEPVNVGKKFSIE
jgi:hypothetical protein